MSIKQKAIQGVVWSVIQNWGSQAGSLIVFLILARLLTPQAFGLVALANVFLAFMQIFLEQGFTQALIQRQELEPEHLNTAFWTNVGSGILLTIIGFALAGFVANFFNQPKLIPLLQCFSFLFIINSLSHVHQALLSRELAFKTMAVRTLIGIFIGGIVGVVMALRGFGVWSLVSQQVVFETVCVIVMWQAVDWRPQFQFSRKHFQELFSFGINVVGFKFLKFFNKRSDNLLIGYFLGEVALGYYAIAYRILQVMTQLLVSTSNQVALPTFSKLQTEPERFRKAFYKVTQFTSLIAFPTFIGVAALSPELIILLFGEEWKPSIPVLQILAFGGIIHTLSFFNTSVFMAMGKPTWRLWLSFLEAVISLIACLFAVQWGIVAVALAYVVSIYIVFPIGQGGVSKLINVPFKTYGQQLVTPTISSLVMIIAILISKYFLENLMDIKFILVIEIAIGIITYSLTIKLIEPKLFQYFIEMFHLIKSRKESVIKS